MGGRPDFDHYYADYPDTIFHGIIRSNSKGGKDTEYDTTVMLHVVANQSEAVEQNFVRAVKNRR